MTEQNAIDLLVGSFRRLNDAQKANLRRHVEAGTAILSGAHHTWFALNGGG